VLATVLARDRLGAAMRHLYTASKFAAKPPQALLLPKREATEFLYHRRQMHREHRLNEAASARSEPNQNFPTIASLPFATNPLVPLEIVNDKSHVSSTPEQFLTEILLEHRPQMEQSLEDAELAQSKPLSL
jgi:hypothetical protein